MRFALRRVLHVNRTALGAAPAVLSRRRTSASDAFPLALLVTIDRQRIGKTNKC
jgi:hypothetical protein